ncbi:hypothetical protein [Escherichia coli]|uniref:hypothetical protein n=1 Tax=Escherichia coli TaxID=562 RepID=UPI0037DCF9A2
MKRQKDDLNPKKNYNAKNTQKKTKHKKWLRKLEHKLHNILQPRDTEQNKTKTTTNCKRKQKNTRKVGRTRPKTKKGKLPQNTEKKQKKNRKQSTFFFFFFFFWRSVEILYLLIECFLEIEVNENLFVIQVSLTPCSVQAVRKS